MGRSGYVACPKCGRFGIFAWTPDGDPGYAGTSSCERCGHKPNKAETIACLAELAALFVNDTPTPKLVWSGDTLVARIQADKGVETVVAAARAMFGPQREFRVRETAKEVWSMRGCIGGDDEFNWHIAELIVDHEEEQLEAVYPARKAE